MRRLEAAPLAAVFMTAAIALPTAGVTAHPEYETLGVTPEHPAPERARRWPPDA